MVAMFDTQRLGLSHRLLRYLLLYTPIPKQGSDRPELSLVWASFWEGCGIEGDTLKGYDSQDTDKVRANIFLLVGFATVEDGELEHDRPPTPPP